MTDRELLELAAKACGMDMHYCEPWECMTKYSVEQCYFGPSWNPLRDDGDALRLAGRLFMSVSTGPMEATACTVQGALRRQFFRLSTLDIPTDEAVRRVIVQAAAEVGQNKD